MEAEYDDSEGHSRSVGLARSGEYGISQTVPSISFKSGGLLAFVHLALHQRVQHPSRLPIGCLNLQPVTLISLCYQGGIFL